MKRFIFISSLLIFSLGLCLSLCSCDKYEAGSIRASLNNKNRYVNELKNTIKKTGGKEKDIYRDTKTVINEKASLEKILKALENSKKSGITVQGEKATSIDRIELPCFTLNIFHSYGDVIGISREGEPEIFLDFKPEDLKTINEMSAEIQKEYIINKLKTFLENAQDDGVAKNAGGDYIIKSRTVINEILDSVTKGSVLISNASRDYSAEKHTEEYKLIIQGENLALFSGENKVIWMDCIYVEIDNESWGTVLQNVKI